MTENGQSGSIETLAGEEGSGARRLAGVYAEALLNAAEKREMVDAVGDELIAIAQEVFVANPRVEQLFASPIVKRSSKEPLLAQAFQGKISDLLFDFLLVLNRKDRLSLLGQVSAAYRAIVDKRAKRVRVLVRSAAPLDEAQRATLQNTMQAALHKEPILDVRIDPELLGGMVVQVGDDVFDASVSTRIQTLRKHLQASSSHEIQVGRDRFSSAS
jgi:F-type H+-transporting ATPase subunit delta